MPHIGCRILAKEIVNFGVVHRKPTIHPNLSGKTCDRLGENWFGKVSLLRRCSLQLGTVAVILCMNRLVTGGTCRTAIIGNCAWLRLCPFAVDLPGA